VATLAQIRDGVKTTLEAAISGLKVYPRIQSVNVLPAVVVYPAEVDPLVTSGRASVSWQLDLYVLTSAGETEISQYRLDELIDTGGARSVIAALFGTDLGLPDTDCLVTGISGYGTAYESVVPDHVGAVLRLLVHTTGP
jgi:hypothetical protein